MAAKPSWSTLNQWIVGCERCERLRTYCARIAKERRRAYLDWKYWGKPVPNFGDRRARLLIIGLAPAAHGANRTGRMFTGDRSGEWLYRALHRSGFANQAEARRRGDGLRLIDCAITATCHCAPPGNKPTLAELEHCREWLEHTFDLIPAKVYLCLGRVAWGRVVMQLRQRGWLTGRTPQFGHGAYHALENGRWLLASYHPSQQNTFTGRLTEAMFDRVFLTARELL